MHNLKISLAQTPLYPFITQLLFKNKICFHMQSSEGTMSTKTHTKKFHEIRSNKCTIWKNPQRLGLCPRPLISHCYLILSTVYLKMTYGFPCSTSKGSTMSSNAHVKILKCFTKYVLDVKNRNFSSAAGALPQTPLYPTIT